MKNLMKFTEIISFLPNISSEVLPLIREIPFLNVYRFTFERFFECSLPLWNFPKFTKKKTEQKKQQEKDQ